MKTLRILALLFAAALTACGGGDIVVPAYTVARSDLNMGYFGAYGTQVVDTKDTVNLWWESHFEGDAKARENILTAAVPTVLMVGDQVFEQFQPSGQNYRIRSDATPRLRAYFQYLHDGGALAYVRRLVPFDEPNTNCAPGEFRKSIALIRSVANEFTDLAGAKFAAIYAYRPFEYEAIELLADVGIDDYSQKSALLANGSYGQLVQRLRPDQHTILVPGGAFGESITPWLNFAEEHSEVSAIVAFAWFPAPRPVDVNAVPGYPWVGIGSGGLRGEYLAAGRAVLVGAAGGAK